MPDTTSTPPTIRATHGWSGNPDPRAALDDIFGPGGPGKATLGIVFPSCSYDLEALGPVIAERFACPVIGCSTAGEISAGGYHESGITAAALHGPEARVEVIEDLPAFDDAAASRVAAALGTENISHTDNAVLITLFDGLCMREEWLSSKLYVAAGGIPMVGASAGDCLTFTGTPVYHDGHFRTGISTCALVRSATPLRPFIGHHYADTGEVLVVTQAVPAERVIREINGVPAVQAYAGALGTTPEALSDSDKLVHPLMVKAGGMTFVRTIQSVLDDGSLKLYCAIEEGVVLHVGRAENTHDKLSSTIRRACVGTHPRLVVMFDCITRRLEADHFQTRASFARAVAPFPAMGLSTYGEQYNGVHVNQTITGVVFGDAA